MAARISIAALKSDPYALVLASNYKKQEHGPAICPDSRCGCDLQGVPRGTRNIERDDGTTEQIDVDAFFRLPKNAAKMNKGHAHRCRYNVKAIVDKFVAISKEIRSFDPAAEPILARIHGGLAEYRLHILMEALSGTGRGLIDEQGNSLGGLRPPLVGSNYIRTNKVLRPYLRMARAINSLIARIQGDPSIGDLLRLKYGDKDITWDEYFYDIDDHARLYNFLRNNGQYKRRVREISDRPIAFVARRRFDWQSRQNRYGQWQVGCEGKLCHVEPNVKAFINPTIYTRDKLVRDTLMSGDFFLVCAIPTISEPQHQRPRDNGTEKPQGPRYPQAAIRLTVVDRSQICAYVPPSTE